MRRQSPIRVTRARRQGRAKAAGGDFLGVQLSGPGLAAGDVTDRGDGTYGAVYTVDDPGEYSLEVCVCVCVCVCV